jgi:hypothetical protein
VCSVREQQAQVTMKRKLSNTSLLDEVDSTSDFNAVLTEYVASPVTTRARTHSFNSRADLPSAVISGLNNSVISPSTTPAVRRPSHTSDCSKSNTPKSKRNGSRPSVRKSSSTGVVSPPEPERPATLKHLQKFTRSSEVDLDMDEFVEEMRREKHNMMLLAEDLSVSGESDVEEKPETKKPNGGVRRVTGTSRTPANWVAPVPGLVEIPATRLRNRQLKEKELLAKAAKETTPTEPTIELPEKVSELDISSAEVAPKPLPPVPDENILDIDTIDTSPTQTPPKPRRKPTKKSPLEQQSFLSTLPLRAKNRTRRRPSTTLVKPDLPAAPPEPEHDSDATSSDEEPSQAKKGDGNGTMTPTSLVATTGFVGLSAGKDAPNVHFVSPLKAGQEGRMEVMDAGSRFYHKRRIKIGNTSKFIPECTDSERSLSNVSETEAADGEVYP